MSNEYTTPTLAQDMQRLAGMKPWSSSRYSLSDVGNGYLFADFYRDVARYAADRGCWMVYNGMVWETDRAALSVMSLCKRLVHLLGQLIPTIESDDVRERFSAHVLRWRTRRTREIALKEAAEVYPVNTADFDADPMVLNCLNGTLELYSGQLRPHNPADFITRLANVSYDPNADMLSWSKFTMEIAEPVNVHADPETGQIDDAARLTYITHLNERMTYTQKAFGYALTGLTHHECLFMLYGPTSRNGKSTLTETFAAMLGSYAAAALPETLSSSAFCRGAPSEDLARLRGARFVVLAEPDRQLRLSPSLLKLLTGNDAITCRFLHENSFEYHPTFKLFLNTNHLPEIPDDSVFASGRVRVIPFEHHFKPGERDPELKDRLRSPENLSAVLNWALAGLRFMLDEGFDPPASIVSQSETYRASGNPVSTFAADCLVYEPGMRLKMADVYRAYRIWCEENGFAYENSTVFKQQIASFASIRRVRVSATTNTTTALLDFKLVSIP